MPLAGHFRRKSRTFRKGPSAANRRDRGAPVMNKYTTNSHPVDQKTAAQSVKTLRGQDSSPVGELWRNPKNDGIAASTDDTILGIYAKISSTPTASRILRY